MGRTLGALRARRQHDPILVRHRHALAGRIQACAADELAIVHAARNHMEALLGHAGIDGEDVALTVAERGHHGGAREQLLGCERGTDPALRFLVRQVAPVMRHGAAGTARPNLPAKQAEANAILGVHRKHRMQQHAAAVAFADLPKPAPAPCGGGEVDLAGVLNREHVTTFRRRRRAFAPALDHTRDRDLVVAEKAIEPHLLGTAAFRQPPQADILARDHAFEKRRPPLSRRRSPNRPSDHVVCASMSTPRKSRSASQRNTPSYPFGILNRQTSQSVAPRCVHAVARKRGRAEFDEPVRY